MSGRAARALALAAALALAGVAVGAAAAPAPPRIVAIGDIHGELPGLREILRQSGLTDAEGRWIGGRSILVQTGDFTDRGPDVRAVMELLMDLQAQAAQAGGRVEVLLGNHEAMNLARALRDVGAEAYERFVDERSKQRRERAYKEWKSLIRRRYRAAGAGTPRFTQEVSDAWMAEHPLGRVEYLEAFGPRGRYGAWLRRLPTVVQIGDTLFIHGGLAPTLAGESAESINRAVWSEIQRFDRAYERLVDSGVALDFYEWDEMMGAVRGAVETSAATGAAAGRLGDIEAELQALASESFLFGANGPLWYRGYAGLADEELAAVVKATLEPRGARRVVAGHNTSSRGRIESRLGGAVLMIDTGMLDGEYYPNGRAAALELVEEQVTAIYPGERVRLEPPVEPEVEPAAEPAAERPATGSAGPGGLPPLAPHPQAAAAPERGRRTYLGPDGTVLPFQDDSEVLDFLRTAEVVHSEDVGHGVTRPKRLTLVGRGVKARAVFHDVDIRKNRVHLRGQGFVMDFRDSYRSQVAAYEVSRLLGMDNVPPAAIRTIDGVDGSVALWIEDAMREIERQDRGLEPPERGTWLESYYDMRVFDNLIFNHDRNAGNILVDGGWKVWLIDHTRAFGNDSGLYKPDLVLRCSRELWRRLRELEPATVDPVLAPIISIFEIRALFKRREKLVRMLEREIERRGEARVIFEPGTTAATAAEVKVLRAKRPPG